MELNTSGEAASSATQEFPNLKAQNLVHKSPPLVPILSQLNVLHITPFCITKINFSVLNLNK
jgi:hypothetical protein